VQVSSLEDAAAHPCSGTAARGNRVGDAAPSLTTGQVTPRVRRQ